MSENEFRESSFGFRSIRPKTREERRGQFDKVLLEKSRLDQRVGHEARINQANAPSNSSQLTSCVSEGAGYISNADRFHGDTAGEEYAARQEAVQKKNRALEFRRNQGAAREEDRWQQIELKKKDDEEYAKRLRDDGLACKKNTSNVAYDILNLQYNQDTSGEQQKYEDDMVRYRAQIRSRNLVIKGDSRSQFNIISGDRRDAPSYPESVTVPSSSSNTARSAQMSQMQIDPSPSNQSRGRGGGGENDQRRGSSSNGSGDQNYRVGDERVEELQQRRGQREGSGQGQGQGQGQRGAQGQGSYRRHPSLMARGDSSSQDMKDPEILQSVAMISKASISPRPQPVALLETSTVTAIFEKEFNSTALIAEYSLVMEMNSSIYDSDDHVVAQISESHRAADISNVADDRWSMDDAIATDKLRLMFGSMQARLNAIATPKEMAFLQRTFNLSTSSEDHVAENMKKAPLSPRRGSAKPQLSPARKKESKSSGAASIKAWSPSSKIDVIKPGTLDGPRSYASERNLPQTPGKDFKAPSLGVGSHSISRKGSQRTVLTSNASTFGAVTPSPSSSRNSSISTCTAAASAVGTVTHLTASRASSLNSVGEGKSSRMRSSTRTITLSSSIVSTSDTGQPDVVKRLFGSAKLPRAPTASARVAQMSSSTPVSNNANNSNGSNNAKSCSSSIRTDSKAMSAVKADRPTSVPLRKPTALILNQVMSSSGDLSSQSTPVQRSQSQRTPTAKSAVSTSVPQSPSKGATGLAVKKTDIGKLFGLVGFTKVDVAPSQVIPFAAISSLITPRSTDTSAVHLDRTMKDAMQRSVTAKATLLAAETAAESARLEAIVAHAEALAAARAVVREEETGRGVQGGSPRSGHPNLATSTVPTTCASTTATTPDTPLSPSDKIEPVTKKDCWMKAGSSSDDLSPKREAENPFKGML